MTKEPTEPIAAHSDDDLGRRLDELIERRLDEDFVRELAAKPGVQLFFRRKANNHRDNRA